MPYRRPCEVYLSSGAVSWVRVPLHLPRWLSNCSLASVVVDEKKTIHTVFNIGSKRRGFECAPKLNLALCLVIRGPFSRVALDVARSSCDSPAFCRSRRLPTCGTPPDKASAHPVRRTGTELLESSGVEWGPAAGRRMRDAP